MRKEVIMPFDGKVIEVEQDFEGCWVSIKSVCDAIGVSNQAQQEKLKNDPSFNCKYIVTAGTDGKQRKRCRPTFVSSWKSPN